MRQQLTHFANWTDRKKHRHDRVILSMFGYNLPSKKCFLKGTLQMITSCVLLVFFVLISVQVIKPSACLAAQQSTGNIKQHET